MNPNPLPRGERRTVPAPGSAPLNVLMLTAECTPFARTGGVAEVVDNLATTLADLGHQVRVMMPWVASLDAEALGIERVGSGTVKLGNRVETYTLGRATRGKVEFFLIGHRRWTKTLYGPAADGFGPVDNHLRAWFFCRAAASVLERWEWRPSVVHCHDYWTGLFPAFLHPLPGKRPPVVFTVHSAAFQGSFYFSRLPAAKRDPVERPLPNPGSAKARWVNFLTRGLRLADVITVVSPTHLAELQEPGDSSFGIDSLLRSRRASSFGILNGIDTRIWNPETDRTLARRFGPLHLSGRVANKEALQRVAGLPVTPDAPLLVMLARLAAQKGYPLLLQILGPLLDLGVQVAMCGDGDREIIPLMRQLSRVYRRQFSYRPFSPETESLHYAGADLFLLPSRFEPCGLTQMKALRYGALPIAHAVGGLRDTISDHDPATGGGTGFLFEEHQPWPFFHAVLRGLAVIERPAERARMQRAGMRASFTWEKPTARYLAVYRQAIRGLRVSREDRARAPTKRTDSNSTP